MFNRGAGCASTNYTNNSLIEIKIRKSHKSHQQCEFDRSSGRRKEILRILETALQKIYYCT